MAHNEGECDFAGMRRYKVRDAKARTQVTLRCDGESCRTANTGKADAIPDYIFTRVIHDFVKIAKLIATEGTVMIEKTNWEPMCQAEIDGELITIYLSRMREEKRIWRTGRRRCQTQSHTSPQSGKWGVDWEEATNRDRGISGTYGVKTATTKHR